MIKANLQYAIDNLKKLTKPKIQEKKDEKDLTLKNMEEFHTERQLVIDAFENGTFSMRNIGIIDDDDDDHHHIYDDELYAERVSTQRTPATLPIILETPPKGSTQKRN